MIKQEYKIKTKHDSSGNSQAKATIEQIHQVLDNCLRTYNIQEKFGDDADPWMGILVATDFAVRSTYHWTKQKNSGPISFWEIYYPPNKSYSELETHTSVETETDIKIRNFLKLHTNRLRLQHWR